MHVFLDEQFTIKRIKELLYVAFIVILRFNILTEGISFSKFVNLSPELGSPPLLNVLEHVVTHQRMWRVTHRTFRSRNSNLEVCLRGPLEGILPDIRDEAFNLHREFLDERVRLLTRGEDEVTFCSRHRHVEQSPLFVVITRQAFAKHVRSPVVVDVRVSMVFTIELALAYSYGFVERNLRGGWFHRDERRYRPPLEAKKLQTKIGWVNRGTGRDVFQTAIAWYRASRSQFHEERPRS